MTADDTQKLKMFKAVVEKLRKSPINRTGKVTFKLNIVSSDPAKEPLQGIDKDDVTLFLITLRQLIMPTEDINFGAICDIVESNCGRPELVEWVHYLRDRWQRTLDGAPFGLKARTVDIDTKKALDYHLYSGLFHSNAAKVAFMESLSPGARAAVEFFVQSALHRLLGLAHLLDCVLYQWIDEPTAPVKPPPRTAARAVATPPARNPPSPSPRPRRPVRSST